MVGFFSGFLWCGCGETGKRSCTKLFSYRNAGTTVVAVVNRVWFIKFNILPEQIARLTLTATGQAKKVEENIYEKLKEIPETPRVLMMYIYLSRACLLLRKGQK